MSPLLLGTPRTPRTQPLLPRRTRCSSTAFPPTQESAALSWKHTNILQSTCRTFLGIPSSAPTRAVQTPHTAPCVSRVLKAGTAARVGRGKAVFAAGAAAAPQSHAAPLCSFERSAPSSFPKNTQKHYTKPGDASIAPGT